MSRARAHWVLRFGFRPLHSGVELVALGSRLQLPHLCGVVGTELHLLVPVALQKCQGQHPPKNAHGLMGIHGLVVWEPSIWPGVICTIGVYIYIWMQPSLKADLLQESKKGVPINAALFRALVRTVLRDATDNLHLPIRS